MVLYDSTLDINGGAIKDRAGSAVVNLMMTIPDTTESKLIRST
jgi:hypothetical protein